MPKLLPLIDSTLNADVQCESLLDASDSAEDEEEAPFQTNALAALKKVNLPTIDRIIQVLCDCMGVAQQIQRI